MYSFTYSGPWLSTNVYYNYHYQVRSKVKNQWKQYFRTQLAALDIPHLSAFTVELRYNSRLDLDNNATMMKIFVDTLKEQHVEDDTKKYYKGLTITPDSDLGKNTYQVIVRPV